MTLSLVKGQNTTLAPGLKKIVVGLGWQPAVSSNEEFDLDASAFLLNSEHKVRSDSDFVFYNQLKSACGSVRHMGDNRTGAGDGDDEQIVVELDKVPADVEHIVFTVTIYEADKRKQNFGMVDDSYIRIVDVSDGNNEEITRFELTEDACTNQTLIFGELYRRNGAWKFRALGQGFDGDLGALARKYAVPGM